MIKTVPGWFSDDVCRAVTGIGNSKRRLYTDDEDVIYRYKRCIMLNGINISLAEPDALDRSILTEVARIPTGERKELSQVMAEFDHLRPKILAFMLDTLVKALQIKNSIQLKNLPRMADFAVWGEAIARAMGYKEMEFINAYYDNIGKQNIEAIEANPLGQAIAKFCEQLEEEKEKGEGEGGYIIWEGSPSELLEKLRSIAEVDQVDTNQRLWPKSTSSLSRRLNQIRSNLLEGLGISVSISRITSSTICKTSRQVINTSIIRIDKMPPVPPIPPVSQNHEGNQTRAAGCISTAGGTMSPVNKIPPVQNTENHAQKSEIGSAGGILEFSKEGNYTKNATLTHQQHFMFDCYHCDNFRTDIKKDYENHVVLSHPGKPCYPSKIDLDRFRLEAKGKDWEV